MPGRGCGRGQGRGHGNCNRKGQGWQRRLEEKETVTTGAVTGEVVPCPACGRETQGGVNFCPNCGYKLKLQQNCSKCGKETITGAIFCSHCGNKL